MRCALVALCGLALACATGPRAGDPSRSAAAAERIYRGHCAACHRLRDPDEQTAERWAWAVERYGPRAHLTEDERRLVLGWLQQRAKDAPARR
jgi:mono/diheme cytochrome c family protein